MPYDKTQIDPVYKNVNKELQYAPVRIRKPQDPARRPNLGTQVVVPKGSPTAGGAIRRVDHKIVLQGYRLVERIKQPRDRRQMKEHQSVGKPRKGR